MIKEKTEIDYPFIRYPRALIDSPSFSHISIEARTLLAMIFDRYGLSTINADKFADENGEVYVIYTLEEVCKKMNCSNTRTLRLFKELEAKDMITRKRKNRLTPYRIYLTDTFYELLKCELTTLQNESSRLHKIKTHELTKREDSYNKNSNNYISNNNLSIIGFRRTEDEIKEQIEYEFLLCESNSKLLDKIIMIMSDVFNGTSPTVRIGKDDMPRGAVIARFCRLDSEHIFNVLMSIEKNETKIKNIKQYLITMLYNEPATS